MLSALFFVVTSEIRTTEVEATAFGESLISATLELARVSRKLNWPGCMPQSQSQKIARDAQCPWRGRSKAEQVYIGHRRQHVYGLG